MAGMRRLGLGDLFHQLAGTRRTKHRRGLFRELAEDLPRHEALGPQGAFQFVGHPLGEDEGGSEHSGILG